MPYKGVRRAGTGDTSRTVLSSVCQPQADRRGFSSEIGRPVVMPPPLPVVMPPPPPVQSEKLVDGAGESASAPTLQEQDVSSLEVILDTTSSEVLITAHSGTASQHTSTLIFSTTCCEELVEAAAEFASGQALQDPDVASSKEESITAGPQTAPHDTVNGSSSAFPSTCDKFVSIPTVTQQDDLDKLFSKLTNEFHGSSSEASITASPRTLPHNITSSSLQSASSIGSNILIRHPPDCFQTFYIRMDRRGSFCTYPDVGGPFHSVHEADDAIKRFLDELRHGGRCKEQDAFSHGDRMKQDCKYFLDGPPIDPNLRRSKTTYDEERYLIEALLDRYNGSYKMLVRSCTSDTQDMWRRTRMILNGPPYPSSSSSKVTYDEERYLIQALLDQYNDLAHELEDLVRKQMLYENLRWYYHFNFTTKQQVDDSTGNQLFFAEVSHMQGEKAWEVKCCCKIGAEDNDGGALLESSSLPRIPISRERQINCRETISLGVFVGKPW